ncbi:DNA repair protein RecN [hydrothermal vent metagenome]|uniref:DNA repair protein RecN n=1 Tax=hydrothermal vent metagenome TaxID=652676 RepID=A0A3B1CRC6_9ZZZZ
MLRELRISDYAIVDNASIEFDLGFNVLTGETGAGKSILIEALGLALGGRSSEEMIRSGADKALVESRFDIKHAREVRAWLAENEFLSGDELVIRRIITRSGKNKAFINGNLATVAQIKEVGNWLVDMHGQHEHQTLFNPKKHLPFLDSFLGLAGEREEYRAKFHEYTSVRQKLNDLIHNQKELERKIDLLKYEVAEIFEASLEPGETEALETEKKRLVNQERLLALADGAVDCLDENENSAVSQAGKARAAFLQMAELDPTVLPVATVLESSLIQIEEAVTEIRRYASLLERDPERLEQVDDRIDLIKNLKRKYGDSIEEILAFGENARKELGAIGLDKENMEILRDEAQKLGQVAARMALALDKKRCEGAKKFSIAVEGELKDLNMARAGIEPRFTYEEESESPCVHQERRAKMYPHGIGKMEILFSGNPGEPPKPLAKIASGGEISRLMLALKTVISSAQPTPVMIFDEIDAGIGGATADRLGEKMRALAKSSQVFCITHLAQVARCGQTQFGIAKKVVDGRTRVEVSRLDRGGRVKELARMAGGERATDQAIKWAEEALKEV